MDITKSGNKIRTDKIINGQTVNYSLIFFFSFILMLVLKQILKIFLPSDISMLCSFIAVSIANFFAVKKFVFNHKSLSSGVKQAVMLIFRMLVNCGIYQVLNLVFFNFLKTGKSAIFIAALPFCFLFNYIFDLYLTFDCICEPEKNKNGRTYKLFFSNRYVVLSSFGALFCILFIFLVFKLFPFGDLTVLRMDLYHQYGPLFTELYDRITNFDSFAYSWKSGGGSSFLGNYFNYLSSPLNIIILLFDRKQMPFFVTTLVALKASLCAGTFTYYLKKSKNSHSFISAGFGILYAFCGYFLAYYWNIMWIDALYLLPLLVLGIENIINKNNSKLYIATLLILFFSSYYMAFMCCIFAVLYFLVYYFSNFNANDKFYPVFANENSFIKKTFNFRFIKTGFNFALSSIFCAALLACILIPVYMILNSCSATSDTFPTEVSKYFNLFDLLSNHLAALTTTIRSSGGDVLPNIYSGILPVILIPLYVCNKDIKLREKCANILLLIFFIFSFDNNIMNFIWHAFHFPNDLPYRFSYMYSFLLLIMAFEVLKHFKSIQFKDIASVGMAIILFIVLAEKFPNKYTTSATIFISILIVIAWTALLLVIKKKKLKQFTAGIIIFSMCICEVLIADCNSFVFSQNYKNYTEKYDSIEEALEYVKENDSSFYRTELNYLNTRMDPCLYNYNGISTFSSMAYQETSQLQYNLGMFGNRINSYTYNTQTPVYNMMFSLKYLLYTNVNAKPSSNLYTEIYDTKDENISVYENNYFLPIAYCVPNEVSNWESKEGNPFEIQSEFFEKATGLSNVFVPVIYNKTECEQVYCDEFTQNGTLYYNSAESSDSSITLDLLATSNSNMYLYLSSPTVETVTITKGEETYTQSISEPFIFDVGKCEFGEKVSVELDTSASDSDESYINIYAYCLDQNVFEDGYNILKNSAIQTEKHSDTELSGKIKALEDGLLYTSIPFDEGWTIYIDGKKAETFSLNSLLYTQIEKGTHEVKLKYTPKGLKAGTVVSIVTASLGAVYLVLKSKKKNIKQ